MTFHVDGDDGDADSRSASTVSLTRPFNWLPSAGNYDAAGEFNHFVNGMTLNEKEETTRKHNNGRKQSETTRHNLFWGSSSSRMQFWGNSNLASDNI